MNVTKPLVGIAALALAGGVALPSIGASGNKYASVESTRDCGDGDSVALNGPLKLWPPNHKMIAEPVTVTDGDGSSGVSITLVPEVLDAEGGDGGPQHDPDYDATTKDGDTITASGNGTATAGLSVRAERSGRGGGRTYTINWMATFDNGSKQCDSSSAEDDNDENNPFVITVPHDMRGGADWK